MRENRTKFVPLTVAVTATKDLHVLAVDVVPPPGADDEERMRECRISR